MQEKPVLATRPTDVKVLVVRDSSDSAERELEMSHHFPSMSEMIGGALGKLESDGYALLDIRYSAIPSHGGGYEHFAMIIGRRHSSDMPGAAMPIG